MQPLLTGWISLWEDLCFCKNKKTAAGLSAVSGEHGIEKNYYALVKGSPCDKGEFTDYLLKDGKNNISTVTDKDTKGSKKAVLLYEKLGEKQLTAKNIH